MIYDELYINRLISEGKDDELCSKLEAIHRSGNLPVELFIPFAVSVMLPPWGDYQYSKELLDKAMEFEKYSMAASIWQCYLYVTLYPEDDGFLTHLKKFQDSSAESSYMLSQFYYYNNDITSSVSYIEKSIEIEKFPNNLYFALTLPLSLSERKKNFALMISDLIVNREAESMEERTFSELYAHQWCELIRGEIVTSFVWNEMKKEISKF